MKKFLLIMMGVAVLFFGACGSNKKADEQKLVVGTNAQFPPFESLSGDKIVGFDIDLINEIAKLINMKVEIKDMDFDGLLPALESNKIDVIIAGMSVTEERAKSVQFTSPYYQTTQTIITQANNKSIKSFDDLKGKKVGVVLGFVGDLLVDKIQGTKKTQYSGTDAAIADLQNSKIEAVVIDSEPAKNIAKNNGGLKVVEDTNNALIVQEDYSIAINPKNKELYNKIENALKTIKNNGTYDSLITKWFSK